MSHKVLYLIIFVACSFTLSVIWWILPTRPVFKAATVTVGIGITGPPPMSKPPLLLDFGDNSKVTFHGTYWHPQTVSLEIGGDQAKNVTINNPAPLSDAWQYVDSFPEGHYWAQIKIVDTIGRTSPYSDKVFFKIGNPPEKGGEEKREPGGESIIIKIIRTLSNIAHEIADILNKYKVAIIIALIVTVILSFLNILLLLTTMSAMQLDLRTFILLIIYFLFGSKRKEKRGVVYNYATGEPVQGVLVNAFKLPEMHQVASAITDKEGTYLFIVGNGDYIVQVKKDGYVFPARIDRKVADHEETYIGQTIHIINRRGVIDIKIPIEVQESIPMPAVRSNHFVGPYCIFNIARIILLILGSIVSVLVLYYHHSTINYILASSYAVLWTVELGIILIKSKVQKTKFGFRI